MIDPTSARRLGARVAGLLAFAIVGALPGRAAAYTIANELSVGCHEQITSAALRTVRSELSTAAPLAITADETALVDDLQFNPDGDMRDLGGATLLAAVRDNDLKGRASDDLSALAEVHGNPDGQYEHCLRASDQKEPGGSEAAVAACRAFIRARALAAIEGLDATSTPDLGKRTSLTIHLSIRGTVRAPLPTYYVNAGMAIHAIEDSFTHTYRTADQKKITVVMDWLDEVNGTLVESRDGPGHATALDQCDDADPLRKTRRLLAIDAASAFLRATLDPQKTNDQKMTAIDAMLDEYLSYSPGCTFDNHWCDAPERQYKNPAGCGCRVGGFDGGLAAILGGGAIAFLMFARRARRRASAGRTIATLGVIGALTLGAVEARADVLPTTTTTTIPSDKPDTASTTTTVQTTPTTTTTTLTTPTTDTAHAPPPPTLVAVKQPGPVDPSQTAFGAYAGFSGSIEKPALAGAIGARLRASKQWSFGLDGEWNPWIAFNGHTVRRGVMNVYGSGILRFPLAYENFNVRLSASLGASYLLSTFYGAPSGTLGIYFGASPLSIEWKLSRIFYLVISPINFALPIPQLKGVPLLYPQYRSTIGIEVYSG